MAPNDPSDNPPAPPEGEVKPRNVDPQEILKEHIREEYATHPEGAVTEDETIEHAFDEMERLYSNPTPKRPRLVKDSTEDDTEENEAGKAET